MAGAANGPNASSSHTVRLVSTALAQDKLAGLSQMLRCIAELMEASGCILWQVAPGCELQENPPRGHLFLLAQWFQDHNTWSSHDLEPGSVTGHAVLTDSAENVPDISNHERIIHTNENPFFIQTGTKVFCTVPITFLDGVRGAVNVYRNLPRLFTEEEFARCRELASLVPALYRTILDKVSFTLIRSVNALVHEAELRAPGLPLPKDQARELVQRMCNLVSETFQTIETSVFLEDRLSSPGGFELMATTCPEFFGDKTTYQTGEPGLTPWVLGEARPMKVFDLAHWARDQASIVAEYPNLTWTDPHNLRDTVRRSLQQTQDEDLPPLSFMAAPILLGTTVLGAIRCCTAKQPPSYFADRELNLLEVVAAQISQFWSVWLSRREIEQENRSWRALVESVKQLNAFAHNELARQTMDEGRIFAEGLRVAGSVIQGAEMMDVRLLDEEKQELYFAATHGTAWAEGTEQEICERKGRRFPVGGEPSQSAGASVYQAGQVKVIPDIRRDASYSATFPSARRMIIAPVRSGSTTFGVLDIRSSSESTFPRNAESIAELVGQQLGLYHYLGVTIGKLQKAEKEQIQAYEDLSHQLKSPIIQAHARVVSALTGELTAQPVRNALLAVRGLLGQAEMVSRTVRLFADLASGRPIQPVFSSLRTDELLRMLVWAAEDYERMAGPERRVKFQVDRKSFNGLVSREVRLDLDLLKQALSCVLDNAAKYSYQDTAVRIYGGVTGTGRLHVSVVNKGLKIASGELKLLVERGFRSDEARWTTGEGSGIGLWIANNVANAHNGELVIIPTNADGLNEVKLLFPIKG